MNKKSRKGLGLGIFILTLLMVSLQFNLAAQGQEEPSTCEYTSRIARAYLMFWEAPYGQGIYYRTDWNIKVHHKKKEWNDAHFWFTIKPKICSDGRSGSTPPKVGQYGVWWWANYTEYNAKIAYGDPPITITTTKVSFLPPKWLKWKWVFPPCTKAQFDISSGYHDEKDEVPIEKQLFYELTFTFDVKDPPPQIATTWSEVETQIVDYAGYDPVNSPQNAIDVDLSTIAVVTETANRIVVDLGADFLTNHISIVPVNSATYSNPASMEVWVGSADDGVAFDELLGVVSFSPANQGFVRRARVGPVRKRYFQLIILDRWISEDAKDGPVGASFAELQLKSPDELVPMGLPAPYGDIDRTLTALLASLRCERVGQTMDKINQGQEFVYSYTYADAKEEPIIFHRSVNSIVHGKDLVFALGWEGSTFKLSVYKPDGSLHTEIESSTSPILITVPDPETGEWTYKVTAIDVPSDYHPFVVMVGAGPVDLISPDTTPSTITDVAITPEEVSLGETVILTAIITDMKSRVNSSTTKAHIQSPDENDIAVVTLFDDGTHGDGTARDSVYTGEWQADPPGAYLIDITASDNAGNQGEAENAAKLLVFIPPTIDIDPNTLNLKSKGKWITCYIELPEGYAVEKIGVSTVRLGAEENEIPAEEKPTEIDDYDEDGIPDLMVKFDRKDLIEFLKKTGHTSGDVTLTINGQVGDTVFQGTDTIRVIGGKKSETEGEKQITQPIFGLSQNYPNPFNPETTIEYDIPEDCHVILKIYNLAGQLIKTLVNEYQTAGHYTIIWHGDNEAGQEVTSGVYFYRLQAGDKAAIKKMVVLK